MEVSNVRASITFEVTLNPDDIVGLKKIYSRDFYLVGCVFRIFFMGDASEARSLSANLECAGERKQELQVSFKLLNSDALKNRGYAFKKSFQCGTTAWGVRKLLPLTDLKDRANGWLNEEGEISMEVTIQNISEHSVCGAPIPAAETLCFHQELESYANSINDLKLISGDGRTFPINRLIFASRSKELQAYLKNETCGTLTFKRMQSDVMEQFVHYLKTESLANSSNNVSLQSAHIAHEFNLPRLGQLLEPFLILQMNGKLGQVMDFAIKFNSKALFKAIGLIERVTEDHFEEESEDLEVEMVDTTLRINHAYLIYKCKKFQVRESKEEAQAKLSAMLGAIKLTTAQGLLDYLKTSQMPEVEEDPFTYARLADEFSLPELEEQVELQIASHPELYRMEDVRNFALSRRCTRVFQALGKQKL